MAIRVVQGLIDGNRLGPDASTARNQPVSGSSTHLSLQQQALLHQQNSALHGNTNESVHQSEAALTTFRSNRGAKGDAQKLRDADSADKLADSIAEKLTDKNGEAKNAHYSLTAANAREHFA